mmetsp:Transcript_136685/g.424617  ORF Transcript_136685/g.424617 Transcript_136685/m.424617 type:complete len:326 (-) Transcript_136685:1741-2718(-)
MAPANHTKTVTPAVIVTGNALLVFVPSRRTASSYPESNTSAASDLPRRLGEICCGSLTRVLVPAGSAAPAHASLATRARSKRSALGPPLLRRMSLASILSRARAGAPGGLRTSNSIVALSALLRAGGPAPAPEEDAEVASTRTTVISPSPTKGSTLVTARPKAACRGGVDAARAPRPGIVTAPLTWLCGDKADASDTSDDFVGQAICWASAFSGCRSHGSAVSLCCADDPSMPPSPAVDLALACGMGDWRWLASLLLTTSDASRRFAKARPAPRPNLLPARTRSCVAPGSRGVALRGMSTELLPLASARSPRPRDNPLALAKSSW